MTSTYDLIVIGSGPAGGRAANQARKKGWKVAIVEEREFGGTCPNRGCDPKKVLVGISEIYDNAQRVMGSGLKGEVHLDWQELKTFKDKFVEPVSPSIEDSLKNEGIDTFKGKAVFQDAKTISLGDQTLAGQKIIIATGAKPATLPVEGGDLLTTSDDFFELEELPDRILFVGGGYISFEFAHLCARLGKDVIILHRGRNVLESFDHEMTNKLIELTKDLGVDIHVGTEVTAIEKAQDGGYRLNVKKFDHEHEFKADLVVHGGGRSPNIDGMQLDKAGIELGEKGIKVNDFYQAQSHSHIYAVGDVAETGQPPLTPVAGEEVRRLLQHLFEEAEISPVNTPVPSVVFTYPKLAKVGLTQQEASSQNIPYEVQSKNIASFFSYKRTNENGAYVKILTNPLTDEIIGAHLLSSSAEHLINIFALAMKKKMTKQELSSFLWAYPSEESDIPSFF
ncbi:dihydrolipoyl dehydrogenase family protein [Halobacillus salinus]|uniref:dihydrolipoyl dehydrogenase family protein n=1 Tax=Halobacillus salinus TaxID=192814 RepID=UPI001592ADF8|nr:NAD(P)/FAD-dependent oxidoreductase [Halobacillus salinus]